MMPDEGLHERVVAVVRRHCDDPGRAGSRRGSGHQLQLPKAQLGFQPRPEEVSRVLQRRFGLGPPSFGLEQTKDPDPAATRHQASVHLTLARWDHDGLRPVIRS